MKESSADRSTDGLVALIRQQLKSGIFGRGAVSFLLAYAGISLSSFVFHVVVSRLLGPSHYGTMGALLGIISLLTVPIGAVQIAVTQAVIDEENKGERFSLSRVTRRATLGGLGATLAIIAVTPVVDRFLHIASPVPMILVALWVPLATVSAVIQGALVGEFRFRPVAFASFTGVGLVRLVLGALMVGVGWGVSGAVAATIFAQIFTMTSLVFSARHELFGHRHDTIVRTHVRDTMLSVAALAGYNTLINIDTFLANHFFVATQAGNYAAVAVAAHIAFFVPAGLVTIAFPHLADGQGVSETSRGVFRQTLLISLVMGALAALFMTVFPHWTIDLLFGAKYSDAASILSILSFESMAIGVLILLVYLHLARRSLTALAPWGGVLVTVVAISLFHGSIRTVAVIMFVVCVVTMVAAMVPALMTRREPTDQTRDE